MFASTSVVSRSSDRVSCDVDDRAATPDLVASLRYGVRDVGTYVWRLLAEPRSVADLCRSVEASFDVEPDTCYADIVRFLGALRQARLVEISQAAGETVHV